MANAVARAEVEAAAARAEEEEEEEAEGGSPGVGGGGGGGGQGAGRALSRLCRDCAVLCWGAVALTGLHGPADVQHASCAPL